MGRQKSSPVRTPADLLGRTIRDDKGRSYEYAKFFRIGGGKARQEVKREGERMKSNNEISNYRVKPYRNVRVQRYPDGGFTRAKIWALFIRK